MNNHPDPLPATLPAGARTRRGTYALTTIVLNRGSYWGVWSDHPSASVGTTPDKIDWASVDIATPVLVDDRQALMFGDGFLGFVSPEERLAICVFLSERREGHHV